MVELLRHRQTKGAATDIFYLRTAPHLELCLKRRPDGPEILTSRSFPESGPNADIALCPFRAKKRLMRRSKTASLFDHLLTRRMRHSAKM